MLEGGISPSANRTGMGPVNPVEGLDRSSSVDWSRRRIARARDMGKQGCAVLVVSARAACGVSAADGETSARCEISATALTLRLTGNETKSAAVARPEERKFLDFSISNDEGRTAHLSGHPASKWPCVNHYFDSVSLPRFYVPASV